MSEEVTIENVTDDDVKRMSDESGVEVEIIESSVQMKRANEKFNKYKRESENDNNKENRSNLTIMKNILIFIPKLFIDTRHGPIKGKVTDIENPQGTDELIIEVSAKHNEIADYNEKEANYGKIDVVENESYDLKDDTKQIEYLLDKTNSEDIGEMVGKKIPIVVDSSEGSPTHSVPEKPYNIADKMSNIIGVYGDYFCSRKESQFADGDNGSYGWNSTALLLGILLMGGLGRFIIEGSLNLGVSEMMKLILATPGVMALIISAIGSLLYIVAVFIYLYFCVRELIYEDLGERYVIREIINS